MASPRFTILRDRKGCIRVSLKGSTWLLQGPHKSSLKGSRDCLMKVFRTPLEGCRWGSGLDLLRRVPGILLGLSVFGDFRD